MCDSRFSQLFTDEERNALAKNEGSQRPQNVSVLSSIKVRFSPQMKHCSRGTVVPAESSALRLRRSISNTVERKPTENIGLHQACKDDMIDVVQELLVNGSCDINELDAAGFAPLHFAAKYDYDDIAKLLLNHGADPDIHNACLRTSTPLQLACWFDSSETVHVLIDNDADVSAGARYGQLAIHCAAARSGTTILEELLLKGKANPNNKDNSGFTPLHIAANTGRVEIVNVLLRYGANIMLQDNDGNTPAHIAAREGHVTTLTALLQAANSSGVSMRYILDSTGTGSCLQLAVKRSHVQAAAVCLQYGASTYSNQHDTSPPLHTACIHGNIELVKLLVVSGASIQADDIEGMTPILRAALAGHVDVVNYLIDQGASLEAAGPLEPSPLMCAVKRGHAAVIRLLLTRGSSIDVRDSSNRTCLHVAVYSENEETLDVLLKHGCKTLVNNQDKSEFTPLHFAAINQNLKMILRLLEFGADTTICDEEEKLPLHHAAEAGDLKCVKALVEANRQSIHATDYRLRTPLYYAALENKNDVVKFLIQNGARVNSRDDDRLTPLLAIAPGGCHKAAIMLLDHGAKIDDLSKNRATALNVACAHGNVAVVKVLLDRGAAVDIKSAFGRGCLGAAIYGGKAQSCMEIIKHKRWKEALNVKDSKGFSSMKGLIENFPEVAKLVMDKCVVTSSNVTTTDPDYSITYNFEFLDVHPSERNGKRGAHFYFGPQTMMESGASRELLFHPLTTELLNLKWNSIAKYLTASGLFMFALFVANFTLFMLCFGQQDYKKGKKLFKDEYFLCTPQNLSWQSYGVAAFTGMWLFSHVYRFFKERGMYFDRYVAMEVSTLVACLMSSFLGEWITDKRNQFGWGILALLLCYFSVLFYIQTIFHSGIYVTMLFGVLKTLVKAMITFVILLFVFAILFHLLLNSPFYEGKKIFVGEGVYNQTKVEIPHPFGNIFLSFVKVIAMMIGELEFTRFFVEQKYDYNIEPLAIFVFLAFCAFLPIVLMNLLIGLAVGDIDSVQKNAEIKLQAIKIEEIYSLEQKIPVAILRYFYKPYIVKYPNRKSKGIVQTLKAVGNQIVGNTEDYDDILEDQEREDMETMEGAMSSLTKRMNQQNNRIDELLDDVQQQRLTLDKLSNLMIQRKERAEK